MWDAHTGEKQVRPPSAGVHASFVGRKDRMLVSEGPAISEHTSTKTCELERGVYLQDGCTMLTVAS